MSILRWCCTYVIQAFFLSGFILYQSEIENSEMDCQPKAFHSAHDGVGNQVFSLEQAVLAEYLRQCFKWHRGGVFLKPFMTPGTVYYVSLRGIVSSVF